MNQEKKPKMVFWFWGIFERAGKGIRVPKIGCKWNKQDSGRQKTVISQGNIDFDPKS
jgi:hypothetical protein